MKLLEGGEREQLSSLSSAQASAGLHLSSWDHRVMRPALRHTGCGHLNV